jgi:hypothetical protein
MPEQAERKCGKINLKCKMQIAKCKINVLRDQNQLSGFYGRRSIKSSKLKPVMVNSGWQLPVVVPRIPPDWLSIES